MKIKFFSFLFVIALSFLFLPSCRHEKNVELLKSHLNFAINESDGFETARLLDRLLKLGIDPQTLPIEESANLIRRKVGMAMSWDTITGDELVKLYGPLEGLMDGTWWEHKNRGAYFWGLMETGQRRKALGLWKKSKEQVYSVLESYLNTLDLFDLPPEEYWLRQDKVGGASYFAIGFVSSKDPQDRKQGLELAKKNSLYHSEPLKEDVKRIQLANPIAQAQFMRLIYNESLLPHCIVESGLVLDPEANPFLADQPETTIRFELVRNPGFEECRLRTAEGGHNRIALGDYDNDGFTDVLVPDQGLWRNLGGSGKFKRVDKELGLDVKGTLGVLADVNNDGLVDVVVAGKNKFGVSLQTQDRIFRPLIRPAGRVPVNPVAIGLLDGDGDGLIDVYLASRENDETGRTEVLRNRGDGTFEEVADAWGFSGEDIMLPGEGVSPGDYDNDGRTDIYVANYSYPNNRNTLWRNVSEEKKTAFVQCASTPWFGDDKQPEIPDGPDRGVEGWQGVPWDETCWGHTSGSTWGDLDRNGTLDLVCANLSHPADLLNSDPPYIMDLSRVYLNTGHSFEDYTLDSGLVYRETNTDPLLADFNNDGCLDLSITNCYRVFVNQLYEGVGDGSFQEVTFRTGAFASNSCGQAVADFDNDGDLDWFVFDGNKGLLLYENKLIERGIIPATANWIELQLLGGRHINGMAYGARVTVMANERSYIREIAGMRGYSSCDDQVVHVGLGEYTGKVEVEVRWIGDKLQRINGLEVNRRHLIIEGNE